MAEIKNQLLINSSRQKVFSALSNLEATYKWMTDLKRVEPLFGQPGEAGFKAKFVYQEGNKEVAFYEEVTEVNPPNSIRFTMNNNQVALKCHISLSQVDDNTLVKMNNRVRGKSFFMRAALPFFSGTMKKRQFRDLRRLKQYVESLE